MYHEYILLFIIIYFCISLWIPTPTHSPHSLFDVENQPNTTSPSPSPIPSPYTGPENDPDLETSLDFDLLPDPGNSTLIYTWNGELEARHKGANALMAFWKACGANRDTALKNTAFVVSHGGREPLRAFNWLMKQPQVTVDYACSILHNPADICCVT
jgi:hypothetical protein